MGAKRWKIEGHDGLEVKWSDNISHEDFSQDEMVTLLQRLASKHLTEHEIISSSRKTQSVGYSSFLKPTISNDMRLTISVGENPYVVASVWQADE